MLLTIAKVQERQESLCNLIFPILYSVPKDRHHKILSLSSCINPFIYQDGLNYFCLEYRSNLMANLNGQVQQKSHLRSSAISCKTSYWQKLKLHMSNMLQ